MRVGGLSRDALRAQLDERGVLRNSYAESLLDDAGFDGVPAAELIMLGECSVGELGLPHGGSLSQVYASAVAQGFELCPPATGPYLRLALTEQATAADSILSAGRAPTGSLTVAAPALRDDDEFPKGFYLRVIDGRPWLRGYRCDDEHIWSPDDRFVFRLRERMLPCLG